jgi:hypothetical protein
MKFSNIFFVNLIPSPQLDLGELVRWCDCLSSILCFFTVGSNVETGLLLVPAIFFSLEGAICCCDKEVKENVHVFGEWPMSPGTGTSTWYSISGLEDLKGRELCPLFGLRRITNNYTVRWYQVPVLYLESHKCT